MRFSQKLNFKISQSLKKNAKCNTYKKFSNPELRNKIALKFNFLEGTVMSIT